MAEDLEVLHLTMARVLAGRDSHVEAADVVAGLDWQLSGERPAGAPHSIFALVHHMTYWLDWGVRWLDGARPRAPKHAAGSWPGGETPASRREWERATRSFRGALAQLDRRAREGDPFRRRGKWSRLEMVQLLGTHTSYHVGQVTLLRQQLGAWPPPSGSVTW